MILMSDFFTQLWLDFTVEIAAISRGKHISVIWAGSLVVIHHSFYVFQKRISNLRLMQHETPSEVAEDTDNHQFVFTA